MEPEAKLDSEHKQLDNMLKAEGFVEYIDKRTLKPMNDPKCTHDWVDDDDRIGPMRAQICRNCPIGRWVKAEASSGS